MRIGDPTPEQVSDLIDWMLDQADLDPPGPPQHAERCLAMKERAWFLKEIVLPKLTARIATVDIPDRPDSLTRTNGFLRGKGERSEALIYDTSKLEDSASESTGE